MNGISLLKNFLDYPLYTSKPVFDKFRTVKGAVYRGYDDFEQKRFLFINGSRKDKVVLVAHADTYFDTCNYFEKIKYKVIEDNGFFIAKTPNNEHCGLGADDRAGFAILWLLKDLGHSILITDGEENGGVWSKWLMEENQDIADLINQHQFMIQFDRRNATDFKTYNVGTDDFNYFIQKETGYKFVNPSAYTDICTLCKGICGVNFSVGYYREHTKFEYIDIEEWENTLNMAKELLSKDLPKFKLK